MGGRPHGFPSPQPPYRGTGQALSRQGSVQTGEMGKNALRIDAAPVS